MGFIGYIYVYTPKREGNTNNRRRTPAERESR